MHQLKGDLKPYERGLLTFDVGEAVLGSRRGLGELIFQGSKVSFYYGKY
jgi:hypothetical protein